MEHTEGMGMEDITQKEKDVFRFKFAGRDYEVKRMVGRAARLNMLSLISLFGELMTAAKLAGVDVVGLVTNRGVGGQQSVAETVANVLILVDQLLKANFFEKFEDKLPVLLGIPESVLASEGDLLETYIVAVNALLFQIGLNVNEQTADIIENF